MKLSLAGRLTLGAILLFSFCFLGWSGPSDPAISGEVVEEVTLYSNPKASSKRKYSTRRGGLFTVEKRLYRLRISLIRYTKRRCFLPRSYIIDFREHVDEEYPVGLFPADVKTRGGYLWLLADSDIADPKDRFESLASADLGPNGNSFLPKRRLYYTKVSMTSEQTEDLIVEPVLVNCVAIAKP